MANVEHSALTGNALHEPKGTSTANSGETYVANGSGSGVWQRIHSHASVATDFNITSPSYAYTLDTDTTEKFVSFTPDQTHVKGFTVSTSPNLRVTYDNTETVHGFISFVISAGKESGADKNVEWVLFKNGTEIAGSRTIRTLGTNDEWGSMSVQAMTTLVENDYIEIKSKASADNTPVIYANLQLSIIGMSA